MEGSIHGWGLSAVIIALKPLDEKWGAKKVLADCYQMAGTLMEHAKEIRAWKSRVFKRNMKPTAEVLRLTGNIHQ